MPGLEGKSSEEIEALAALADSLSSNPKTREGFLLLTKAANPEASIPEIDIPRRIQGLVQPYVEKITALEAKITDREARDKIEEKRRSLGVSREELDAIEKVMIDKGIANHETAREFIAAQSRVAEPTPASTSRMYRPAGKDFLPSMNVDEARAQALTMAHQVVDELRGRRAA